jgi:hypothetical protein
MHLKFWSENLNGRDVRKIMLRREDNIRMDLTETVWKGLDWIGVYQDRD